MGEPLKGGPRSGRSLYPPTHHNISNRQITHPIMQSPITQSPMATEEGPHG